MLALSKILNDVDQLHELQSMHLPRFLEKQRWYTSKGQQISSLQIQATPGLDSNHAIWLLHIAFADGMKELRVLPVASVQGPFEASDSRVIAQTDTYTLLDAMHQVSFRESLYTLMSTERRVQDEAGVLFGKAGIVCQHQPSPQGSRLPPQNSSNTVVLYEPEGFFKLFRKTESGTHPDAELLDYLSTSCNFENVPAFGGSISFLPKGEKEAITLGLMLGKVDHQGEAWETLQGDVAAFAKTYRRDPSLTHGLALGSLFDPLRPAALSTLLTAAIGETVINRIVRLGRRTAEMHTLFARGTTEAIKPETLTSSYWDRATAQIENRLVAELAYASTTLKPSLEKIANWLKEVDFPTFAGGCIRVHGDYHLGQVLDTEDDVVIIDFEGEPLHSLAYRRKKHPAFKDVAGMIRSLHYAPFAFALQQLDGAGWAMDAGALWFSIASRLFLTSYLETAQKATFLPKEEKGLQDLLSFFLVDKVLYELAYERSSRPGWISIPATGLQAIAERLER